MSKVTIPSGHGQAENINLSEDKLKLYLHSTRNVAIELNYFEVIQNTLNYKQVKQFSFVRQLIRKQSLNIFQLICTVCFHLIGIGRKEIDPTLTMPRRFFFMSLGTNNMLLCENGL